MGANELRYGSLFSGIGGIDLGMDMAGFECAWQVEIDGKCRQVLEQHWPGVPKYGDISEVKGSKVEPVDILCGGFPCQPVSVAGKRGGVDDERWLWDEFYRLICEIRPRWVVAENVPGLLSANFGRAFAGVLRDLAEGGYDAVWDVYPAGGPGGVGAPHRRERIFIVAHTDSSKQTKESGDVREESKVSSVDRKNVSAIVSGGGSENVANTSDNGRKTSDGRSGRQMSRKRSTSKVSRASVSEHVADTNSERRCGRDAEWQDAKDVRQPPRCQIDGQWDVEPNVGRVANGVPNRVDRLRELGNGVVPQVAYKVARMIYEYTEKEE